jgi:hypothetical protein
MKYLIALLVVVSNFSQASFNEAYKIFSSGEKARYPQLVSALIEEKMYFAAAPFIKEYLAHTNKVNDELFDKLLDQIITEVGVKQFEVFPNSILEKSNAPTIRYILARKSFRHAKYNEALRYLQKYVADDHPVKPYALLLEASIFAVTKKEVEAIKLFKDCVNITNAHIGREKNTDRIKQLKIARDYCIVGVGRSQFAATKFEDAYSSYLDLQKSSHIWPEILFEEAWNSFYLRDYNRTLGKLVTYKAPVFTTIFNPEIEVLRTLTYMELCLWNDTNKSVEDFYNKYETSYESYKKYLTSLNKDYKLFYSLIKDGEQSKNSGGELVNLAVRSIARDPAYVELMSSFSDGKKEIENLKKVSNKEWREILDESLKESLNLQRDLIGSYARGQMMLYSAQMQKAFEDMSYIKLEVLSKKKNELYSDGSINSYGKRGDIAHLKRTDKQYFWTFNGEFWADELGDYVFSLKSECK